MEKENELVEALLVEDGIIRKVGALSDIESELNEADIERYDLKGQTLLPGFIDPHGHIAMMGPFSQMADLTDCNNFQEIMDVLNNHIKENKLRPGDNIVGYGYDVNFMEENRHPTKEILNKVSSENPIFLFHGGGHVGCTNEVGLNLLGIDSETPDAQGGHIGRVEGSSEPNGYLEEGNWLPVQNIVYQYTEGEMLELINDGQEYYTKNGITTVQEGAASIEQLELLKILNDEGKLKIDVVAYPLIVENPEAIGESQKYDNKYSNRLKIGGYKFFLDGSPQGKTAWMTEPYEGEETYREYPWYDDEQVKHYVQKAIDDNKQLLTHCNGDAASDQLLKNYERALKESDNPNKQNLRPVMIHCQTVRDDQLDQMSDLSMIPSIFLAHVYHWGDVHLKNLGEKRGNRISPVQSAFDRGLKVNFHQDAPVIPPNMIETLWCATNRITKKGVNIGVEECVSVYDALKAITINAAYAYFEEDKKGSLKKGKIADFVILDRNPLQIDKRKIRDINVMETIKEGEQIFKNNKTLKV